MVAVMAFGMFNAGIEYFPEDIPPANVYVQVEAPVGTRLDQTDAIIQRIQTRLAEMPATVDFASVLTTVGSQITADGIGRSTGSHLGTVAVNFVDFQDRQFDAFQTLELMRSTLGEGVAGADISVEKPRITCNGSRPPCPRRSGSAASSCSFSMRGSMKRVSNNCPGWDPRTCYPGSRL